MPSLNKKNKPSAYFSFFGVYSPKSLSVVELGDTASPSETSLGHNSTRIVPCFVLAETY